MNALDLDLARATANLDRISAAIRAAVLADPVGAAIKSWRENGDPAGDSFAAEQVGNVVLARIDYDPDRVFNYVLPLADLPADPTARHDELYRRLDDFSRAVDDLAAICPDHSPNDLEFSVRSARAARLADRYIHERDPAALAELFATLHHKS